MSISASDLSASIKNKLNSATRTSSLSVHNAWADGIREYLTDNLQVSGAYSGTTNTVPPVTDPLNGNYDWAVTTYVLTGSMLLDAVSGSTNPAAAFAAWIGAIETATKAITFVGPDIQEKITTSPGLVFSAFSFSISQSDIEDAEDLDEIVDIIAGKMYDSLIATNISGVTSSATSTTPGSGTVTYATVK